MLASVSNLLRYNLYITGGDHEGVNVSLLEPLVRKAELSRSEIQILIDLLLNKQQGSAVGNSEWIEVSSFYFSYISRTSLMWTRWGTNGMDKSLTAANKANCRQTFLLYIQEVIGSYVSSKTSYPDIFLVIFLSPYILSNSLFIIILLFNTV